MTNPCFYLYPCTPKRFQYVLFFPRTHFTKQLFTYLFPSERSIHHSNSSFPGKKYLISLFSSGFQKGGFHFFSTSPTLELSASDSIISKQTHYPNCRHWTNGDPQYADCIPRNLNCFPRIYSTFFKLLNHIGRSTEKTKYRANHSTLSQYYFSWGIISQMTDLKEYFSLSFG